MFLTESQKSYYTAMKKLGRKKPRKVIRRPINAYLALCYDISMSRRFSLMPWPVSSVAANVCLVLRFGVVVVVVGGGGGGGGGSRFEIAIFAMIFFNMVVMAVEHYGQPPTIAFILELFNALFTTMFALGPFRFYLVSSAFILFYLVLPSFTRFNPV